MPNAESQMTSMIERFHISPAADKGKHVLDECACPCRPQIYEEAEDSIIIVHRYGDGRECHNGVASGWRKIN